MLWQRIWLTVLLSSLLLGRIQDHLLHALHANSHNWPTLVQAHALSLLRSGEITSFPALLKRVMDDVRQDTAQASSGAANPSPHLVSNATLAKTGGGAANAAGGGAGKGMEGVNGNGNGNGNKVNGDADGGESGTAGQSLALPPAVVAEALRIARESLEMVCEVEENGAT
jgi:hypothetical protein